LAQQGGQVLLLGVDQTANTMIHTGEAYAGVGYWGQARPDRTTGRYCVTPDGGREWVALRETPGDSSAFMRLEPALTAGRTGQ
jgi:aminoglycoside N3'-acetyltransferase